MNVRHLLRQARAALCGAALTVACNGNEAPKPEMAAPLPAAPASASAAQSPAAPATSAQAAPSLTLEVVRAKAGVGLRVINADRQVVSLAAQVTLHALRGESVVPIPDQSLTLQLSCKSQGCVRLAPGAEIDGPAWLERVHGEHCGALILPSAAGRYRLRVQTCDGAHSREVEFAWPQE